MMLYAMCVVYTVHVHVVDAGRQVYRTNIQTRNILHTRAKLLVRLCIFLCVLSPELQFVTPFHSTPVRSTYGCIRCRVFWPVNHGI